MITHEELLAELYMSLSRISNAALDPAISKEAIASEADFCLRRIDELKLNVPGLLITPILKHAERRRLRSEERREEGRPDTGRRGGSAA